jgi:hypothetical protein
VVLLCAFIAGTVVLLEPLKSLVSNWDEIELGFSEAAANLPHCCFGGLLLLRHIETLLGVLDPLKCLLA